MMKTPYGGSATPIEDITATKHNTLNLNRLFRKEASGDADK